MNTMLGVILMTLGVGIATAALAYLVNMTMDLFDSLEENG